MYAAVSLTVNETLIPVILAVLSSGFLFGLFKVMPERRSILVQASENAVKVVNDAIGTLRAELADARAEIAVLRKELTEAQTARKEAEVEIRLLEATVTKLEAQLLLRQRWTQEIDPDLMDKR